jgi:hypothetical protein
MPLRGTVSGGSSGLGGTLIGTAGGSTSGGSIFMPAQPAPAPVPAPAPAPPPEAPVYVAPMPTADDLLSVNDWLTNWRTTMEDIDFSISQQGLDTNAQKSANERQAVEDRVATDEAMAARGIFSSSLRDAAVYDVETTKALANTYLDAKLQEAITQGATRKQTLADSKTKFEQGMSAKYAENAESVNSRLREGYAEALANYKPPKAQTANATGPTAASKRPAPVAVSSGPQQKSSVAPKKGLVGTVVGKPVSGLGKAAAPKKPSKPKRPANRAGGRGKVR